MNEELIKALLVGWQGILDRLEYDEKIIDKNLREIFEDEFRYLLSIVFGNKDIEKLEKAVKEIIRASFN
jgi:hypothetical protein